MFSFTVNNDIIGLSTQRQQHVETEERFQNYSTRPSANGDGTRPAEVEKLRTHVPGDARVAGLPIACHVEFEQKTRRAGDGSFYEQAGEGSCKWSLHRANQLLVPNSIVRFRRGPSGAADAWFRLVDVKESRGLLTDTTSIIEFRLEKTILEPVEA